jgi:ABC-type transporter Mla subunit MlaD
LARNQNWKAGLFVISAVALVAAAVVLIAGINLSTPRHHYTIRFAESVAGLDMGSAVKYRGVDVGRVEEIRIPPDDITKVEVEVAVDKTMPIRTDTRAILGTLGITGIRFVDLQTGSTDAPTLPPGSVIPSRTSLFETLGATAQTAAEKVDILLDNLVYITDRSKVDYVVDQLDKVFAAVAAMEQASAHVDSLAVSFNQLLDRNEGRIDSSLARLEGVLIGAERTFDEIESSRLLENMSEAAAGAREVTSDLHGIVAVNRHTISETLANLRETSANLNDFSRVIRDRPSLLLRSSAPKEPSLPGVR